VPVPASTSKCFFSDLLRAVLEVWDSAGNRSVFFENAREGGHVKRLYRFVGPQRPGKERRLAEQTRRVWAGSLHLFFGARSHCLLEG